MNTKKCPVCGCAATHAADPFADPFSDVPMTEEGEHSVGCEQCGQFCAENGFLAHGWRHVPVADKKAIAAYLKKTKEKQGCVRDLTFDSWRYLVWQGKKILAQH